jgi:hypothetical protein
MTLVAQSQTFAASREIKRCELAVEFARGAIVGAGGIGLVDKFTKVNLASIDLLCRCQLYCESL